jgi:hypothetical protein
VQSRLQSDLRRVVRARRGTSAVTAGAATTGELSERYEWSHATLPDTVRASLGQALADRYTASLDHWAEAQGSAGWGPATPGYLETGYISLLTARNDTARILRFALDRDRHDWLRSRRGGTTKGCAKSSWPRRRSSRPASLTW